MKSTAVQHATFPVACLAAIAAVSILSTPRLGRWADVIGPRKARVIFALIQLIGMSLFLPFGNSLWGLLVPLVIVNLVGPPIDVTGRMTFLSLEPDLLTRLTTVYIVLMFVGGGIGSIFATSVYGNLGWTGVCGLLTASSAFLTLLAWRATKLGK